MITTNYLLHTSLLIITIINPLSLFYLLAILFHPIFYSVIPIHTYSFLIIL